MLRLPTRTIRTDYRNTNNPSPPHSSHPFFLQVFDDYLRKRAAGLGLLPDTSFEDIIREYIRENTDAIQQATA